jgi:hypothetical protein
MSTGDTTNFIMLFSLLLMELQTDGKFSDLLRCEVAKIGERYAHGVLP